MQKTIILQQLCKNSNNFFNQKKAKKKHLQANGFQSLKKTFINNGV
jgi:hypothetical protein